MWHFLNSNAGAAQAASAVIVALLTLVLARATLRYVQMTGKIAAASVAQAEAIHKPVLTLKLDESVTVDISKQIADVMKGRQHACIGAVLEVTNIGTGPALHVTWSLKRFSQAGGFIPYVAVGQSVSLRQGSKLNMAVIPTEFEVLFTYSSLSGTKYLSRTMVENSQEIANFEITIQT